MIFNEWKTVKVGETIISSNTGLDAIKRAPIVDYNSGIKCLRIQDISQNKNFEDQGYCLVEEKNFKKFQLVKGDIIVARTGATIGVNRLIKQNLKAVYNNGLIRIKSNADIINTDYLYYNLQSHKYKGHIQAISGGTSTQPNMKMNALLDYEIKLPSLNEQKAIAHILSTLDDKIEVNNQINKTLENMAQAYFDDMFPNVAAGDTTIGEYITPKRGKNLLSKDAISGEVPVIAGGLSPATYHNVSNTQSPVITISASGANAGFVNLWTVPVWSSDSSFIDYGITKDVYFWYVMLKKRQKEIYDSQTGSAQPHIYPKHITIMPTIKLNVDEINLYTKRVTPLFKKIANNLYEISKLQLIRETLLPKLMSGKIRAPLDSEGDAS